MSREKRRERRRAENAEVAFNIYAERAKVRLNKFVPDPLESELARKAQRFLDELTRAHDTEWVDPTVMKYLVRNCAFIDFYDMAYGMTVSSSDAPIRCDWFAYAYFRGWIGDANREVAYAVANGHPDMLTADLFRDAVSWVIKRPLHVLIFKAAHLEAANQGVPEDRYGRLSLVDQAALVRGLALITIVTFMLARQKGIAFY